MKKMLIALFLLLGGIGIASAQTNCPATGTDSSTTINNLISNAVKLKQNTVVLGACEYDIKEPIILPAGTVNFTLSGAGSNSTIIKTLRTFGGPGKSDVPIMIGPQFTGANWWPVTNANQFTIYTIQPVAQGATTIPSGKILAPGYYALYDSNYVENLQESVSEQNHLELIKVDSFKNGIAILDKPVTRNYWGVVNLSYINKDVDQNITINHIGFNGTALDGSGVSYNFISASLIEGLTINDINVDHYQSNGINITGVSDFTVSDVVVGDPTSTGPGYGYGLTADYSHRGDISYVSGQGTVNQQLTVLHRGTNYITEHDINFPTETLDMHGYCEDNITFTNITASAINVGNGAWSCGESNITINNSTLNYIDIQDNINGLTLNSVNIGHGNAEWPMTFSPVQITFCSPTVTTACITSNGSSPVNGNGDLLDQNITFNNVNINGATSFEFLSCGYGKGSNGCNLGVSPSGHIVNWSNNGVTLYNSGSWGPKIAKDPMQYTNMIWSFNNKSNIFGKYTKATYAFIDYSKGANTASAFLVDTSSLFPTPYNKSIPILAGQSGAITIQGNKLD